MNRAPGGQPRDAARQTPHAARPNAQHQAVQTIVNAHAPYNFVPLPDQARVADASPPPANMYHPERLSGYIDCTITPLTPLYIRSTLTQEEYTARAQRQRNNLPEERTHAKPDFFSP